MMSTEPNELIHESSPYLLQHAYNPVQWKAWNDQALEEAQTQDKPLLISIGYAACHWCHVMEEESFEDYEVAEIMNTHFVNIKIDREERPDLDHVYMGALQLMKGNGGWPLNIVALPDGRPFWGATYLPKENWKQSLEALAQAYKNDRPKVEEYAAKLQQGMQQIEQVIPNSEMPSFSLEEMTASIASWSTYFDTKLGGINRAPKFMMPTNLNFLMRWAYQTQDTAVEQYVLTTLRKMAYGGVYDQIGGGFARYSVDTKWHVPHFEKMLYDNAQLISLYSEAYSWTKDPEFRQVVLETIAFTERKLQHAEGYFYSSLDADSLNAEGETEEGAFYVWKAEELSELLEDHFLIFQDYFNINDYGYWENGTYVLIRNHSDDQIAQKHGITIQELQKIIGNAKKKLLEVRSQRPAPRLDDKTLTSWNALMISAYLDAYAALNDERYLQSATRLAAFIKTQQLTENRLYHSFKNGKSSISGFLEDYSLTIQAFLDLYQHTTQPEWLETALVLTETVFEEFHDSESQLFLFTSKQSPPLAAKTIEKSDNVIPASNSVLAKALYKLGMITGDKKYLETAETMLNNMKSDALQFGSSHANWMDLMMNYAAPYYEVAVVGETHKEQMISLSAHFLPNVLLVSAAKASELPLLKNRYVAGKTLIYVCQQGICKLPSESAEDALELLQP